MDFWDLPYTSEDLKELYDFIYPERMLDEIERNLHVMHGGYDSAGDDVFRLIKEADYRADTLPLILGAMFANHPIVIMFLTCPFNKLPLYTNKYKKVPNKIVEWRLKKGI